VDEQANAKTALTELFAEVKNGDTPMVVERIVTDIDEIVRLVRFPGWQNTKAGEREVQKGAGKKRAGSGPAVNGLSWPIPTLW